MRGFKIKDAGFEIGTGCMSQDTGCRVRVAGTENSSQYQSLSLYPGFWNFVSDLRSWQTNPAWREGTICIKNWFFFFGFSSFRLYSFGPQIFQSSGFPGSCYWVIAIWFLTLIIWFLQKSYLSFLNVIAIYDAIALPQHNTSSFCNFNMHYIILTNFTASSTCIGKGF